MFLTRVSGTTEACTYSFDFVKKYKYKPLKLNVTDCHLNVLVTFHSQSYKSQCFA